MSPENILIEIIEEFFQQFGIKYKRQEPSLQLTRYFNFRLKYIIVGPREIRISDLLLQKIQGHPHQNGITDILANTVGGRDLNPYQSKDSFNADFHDGLFNDWGIHHLHLDSTKKKAGDYFNARTGLLLFVRFTEKVAYFLDIKSHSDINVWSDRDLIRIIQKNWPDSIKEKEVEGVQWYPDLTDEQIGKFRRPGVIYGLNVDGKSYLFLGHGQATSGDNLMASRMAGEAWRWVGQHLSVLETNPSLFKQKLKDRLGI